MNFDHWPIFSFYKIFLNLLLYCVIRHGVTNQNMFQKLLIEYTISMNDLKDNLSNSERCVPFNIYRFLDGSLLRKIRLVILETNYTTTRWRVWL